MGEALMGGEAVDTSVNDQGGSGDDSQDGEVVDYSQFLQTQKALQETGSRVENLEKELNETRGFNQRIRHAITGEDDRKLSPLEQREKYFSDFEKFYEDQAAESRKRGGSDLPLTLKAAKEMAKLGRESARENAELRKQLDDINKKLERQQNPAWEGLRRAAYAMEGMVQDGLEQMYPGDESTKIRGAQFNAVTKLVNDEIKDLMENDPDTLLKIQRSPKLMRNMVNHFMAQVLPPKVRARLEDEAIENEQMDARQLFSAFAEAKEAWEEEARKDNPNPKRVAYFSELMTKIRQDILAEQQASRRGANQGKPSLNDLFGGRRG